MIITMIAIAGGTIAISQRVSRNFRRSLKPKSWIDYCTNDDVEFSLTDDKREGLLLRPKINAFHQMLQVDTFVPISRQIGDRLFQPTLSPWEDKKITLYAKPYQAQSANHQPRRPTQQTEDSMRDNLRLLWRYFLKYWRPLGASQSSAERA